MNLNEHKVYVLPVDDTYDYVRANHPEQSDFVLYVDEEMPENECQDIINKTYDKVADVMTLRQFQGQFNFALDANEISSNDYLIKIF